jgi:hypothetical protein
MPHVIAGGVSWDMAGERWGLVLALLSTLSGCGGGGGDANPFRLFQAARVTADCQIEVLCGEAPEQATCESGAHDYAHEDDTLQADIAAGRVVYDGAKAQACIDRMNGVTSCAGGYLSVVLQTVSSCWDVLTGQVPAGGTCYFDEECAGRAGCVITLGCDLFTQCCAGTCSATPLAIAEGADCSGGEACVPGTFCSSSTTPATCMASPSTVGASCTESTHCAAPLYCSPTTSTCQELPLTGAPCALDGSYGGISCQNPLDTCDRTTNTCVRLAGPGEACDPTRDNCVAYASCDPTANVCVDKPVSHQAPTSGPCR